MLTQEKLLQKVFRCVEARDAAHDPRFVALWENHAAALRNKIRALLDKLEGA
jgi:hypothetical protein